jgi:cysteine desulfurase family protein (TIGR01976 family)
MEGRLDVARVRGLFPALADGFVHADGPGGALFPESVARAVGHAMRMPIAARGGIFPASGRAEAIVSAARAAIADLVGGLPGGVVLGPSRTALTWQMARAVARTWSPGDEIVVSRLDHDANIRPWVTLAEQHGVLVRWAEVDIETGELPVWQYDELLTARTRLVALTAASGVIGTCPEVGAITARAHAVGALAYVDATQLAPHRLVDRVRLGADLLTVAARQWGGPSVGAVVAEPALLQELWPDRLAPTPDRIPDRFESSSALELLAGVPASVDHLASVCPDADGARRDRLQTSMAAVEAYERPLFEWLDEALRAMRHVTVIGAPRAAIPALSFTVAHLRPRQVTSELSRRGICAWDGDGWARELFDSLGVSEQGGAVQLGLMHYNTAEEVGYLIDAVAALRLS